jgi:broad specificity phosphatase PhoE
VNTLFLVRHGQASFGKANYDKLSDTGELQCRLLGDYWASQSLKFDAVYSGTLERQRQSLAMIREAYAEAGLDLPASTEMPEFDEFDSEKFMTQSIPQLQRDHPDLIKLMIKLAPRNRTDPAEFVKNFELAYDGVMGLWRSGELNVKGMESCPEFNDRVVRGLDRVMAEEASDRTVLLMSSGGPIAVMARRALKNSGRDLSGRAGHSFNSSVTEFSYGGDELSLVNFSQTPHLDRPELVTRW